MKYLNVVFPAFVRCEIGLKTGNNKLKFIDFFNIINFYGNGAQTSYTNYHTLYTSMGSGNDNIKTNLSNAIGQNDSMQLEFLKIENANERAKKANNRIYS